MIRRRAFEARTHRAAALYASIDARTPAARSLTVAYSHRTRTFARGRRACVNSSAIPRERSSRSRWSSSWRRRAASWIRSRSPTLESKLYSVLRRDVCERSAEPSGSSVATAVTTSSVAIRRLAQLKPSVNAFRGPRASATIDRFFSSAASRTVGSLEGDDDDDDGGGDDDAEDDASTTFFLDDELEDDAAAQKKRLSSSPRASVPRSSSRFSVAFSSSSHHVLLGSATASKKTRRSLTTGFRPQPTGAAAAAGCSGASSSSTTGASSFGGGAAGSPPRGASSSSRWTTAAGSRPSAFIFRATAAAGMCMSSILKNLAYFGSCCGFPSSASRSAAVGWRYAKKDSPASRRCVTLGTSPKPKSRRATAS
mmetsp:Transcript_35738/g.114349  ORF Transcript_35738/g.114349 Transcript_35738/m.114349 type:complete len:368 (-) Transcript_35738:620-1723(-)